MPGTSHPSGDADSSISGAALGGIGGAFGATVAFSTVSGPLAIAGVTAGITLAIIGIGALVFDVDLT
ncbi:hypothetical protein [Haloarchaeobius iranensis]|uniref:Uncharacterized protein n=1 Tax=Haloarchaeobius iranensis TaxID=996166 RepID=A0A1G9YAJ1_9EURY|nr:hypothetical protein [Haloarchaeobius iranensis]SDN05656.1 hypothetical protein SAMN05192554_11374 [Haloarchaeobius iranensis]